MILHRFRRLVGVLALTLAPSLALAQSALQQPVTSGPKPDAVPTAFNKLYANDLFLQNLVAGRFNTLGAAAYLNVGTVAGTVADGGAVTAETARAIAAEQAITTNVSANATAIANETSRAQSVEVLKAPLASPIFTGVPRVPTAAQGTSGTQAASLDFVATAVAAGAGGNQGVPPSRQILTGGLATGGGDLTADRTITVPKATQTDVATGTDDAKALTSFSIAAALGAKAPYTAVVRTDVAQSLTAAQRILAKQNIGAGPTGVQSTSASMTLDGSAAGKLIFTGTAGIVITLPTVAQIGTDQFVAVLNNATSAISVAPQGASNIFTAAYGGVSLTVPAGALLIFQNDGTNWVTSSPASTLSPAFTGNPTAPTQAAADNSTKLATTAFVATAIGATNQSLAVNGYKKLPGGLIIQWIRVSFSSTSDANLTWPIAFPNSVFSLASGILTDGDPSQSTIYSLKLDNLTTSGVIARVRQVSNGGAVIASTGATVMITAIGY
ncbi:gp53-like domain-containing protein [Methylobacterium fujisawaense]|uniref:gp53-like domain-containing protein n=2 Tax=Bacteria TaxID=2 RepID=UPI003701C41D